MRSSSFITANHAMPHHDGGDVMDHLITLIAGLAVRISFFNSLMYVCKYSLEDTIHACIEQVSECVRLKATTYCLLLFVVCTEGVGI